MRCVTCRVLLSAAALVAASAAADAQRRPQPGPGYLYVWATAVDTAPGAAPAGGGPARPRRRGAFLAAVDLRDRSPSRGRVVAAVLAADTAARAAHHTEHALAADGLLFANDFFAGRTYRFDLRAAGAPRLLGGFAAAGPLGFPHSFERLAGGTVLATYQRDAAGRPPGGLVELRRDGTAVRWTSAATPSADATPLEPYSLSVLPALDRVVTTSFSMAAKVGVHVQVWRLSDLALLHTLVLPAGAGPGAAAAVPAPAGHDVHDAGADTSRRDTAHHRLPGEPRVLADGRTVMLGTFTCGLYTLTGLDGPAPRLALVHAFPGRDCAVPVRVGRWWLQTVPEAHALVALDVADPLRPREASRLAFDSAAAPHWVAADASGRRLAVTSAGFGEPRVRLVAFDPSTGALAADAAVPSVDLSRVVVPGLGVVRAIPHGAVFGPAAR